LPIELVQIINEMAFETNIMSFFRDNNSYQVEDYKHFFYDKNIDMFKFICSGEFFRHVFHELVISTKLKLEFLKFYLTISFEIF
jgi:hypothetical protein